MEMTRILAIPEALQLPVSVTQHTSSTLLTVLAFAFFGLVLVVHTRLQRQAQDRRAVESQSTLTNLTDSFVEMKTRMVHIDRSLQRLVQRIDQVQLAQSSKEGFQHARHLSEDGATTKQLIELCGLTQGEAELFKRLHS